MNSRRGAYIVLGFATVWLWVGSHTLPAPFNWLIGLAGLATLGAAVWHVVHRPMPVAQPRQFIWRRFWVAIAFEVIAANVAGSWLASRHAIGYIWPAVGIIVGLHFIGLWWASLDRRFLTLTVAMTAINLLALFLPEGGPAMLAVSGLGSAAVLAIAVGRR